MSAARQSLSLRAWEGWRYWGSMTCGAEDPLMDFLAASAWVIYLIIRQSKSSRPMESLFFNF